MLILGTICMLTMCLKNHIGTVADEGKLEQERSRPGGTSAETNDEATSIVCFFMLWPLADFGLPCLKDPLLFLKILSSLTGSSIKFMATTPASSINVNFSFSPYRSLLKYKLRLNFRKIRQQSKSAFFQLHLRSHLLTDLIITFSLGLSIRLSIRLCAFKRNRSYQSRPTL